MKWWVLIFVGAAVAALSGVSWAGEAPDGKPLFLKYKCNSCHSIDAAKIAKKTAADAEKEEGEAETTSKAKPRDLSSVGLEHKADWIALFMQKQEKLEGKFHRKKFRGTDADLATLSAWLETMKAPKAKKEAEEAKEAKEAEKPKKSEGKSEK
jgi:cytochrome c553